MQKLKSNILLIILVFLFMYTLPVYASETIKIALIDNYTKFESGDDFGWGLDTNYGAILAIEECSQYFMAMEKTEMVSTRAIPDARKVRDVRREIVCVTLFNLWL
ncbi:hypothetical protein KJ708_05255, partial [bacterium]|nr:hypothetical protein [bacterium]